MTHVIIAHINVMAIKGRYSGQGQMKWTKQDRPDVELVFHRVRFVPFPIFLGAVELFFVVLHESFVRYDPGNCFLLPSMGSSNPLSKINIDIRSDTYTIKMEQIYSEKVIPSKWVSTLKF